MGITPAHRQIVAAAVDGESQSNGCTSALTVWLGSPISLPTKPSNYTTVKSAGMERKFMFLYGIKCSQSLSHRESPQGSLSVAEISN